MIVECVIHEDKLIESMFVEILKIFAHYIVLFFCYVVLLC